MKRTVEKVLVIVALVLQLLVLISGLFLAVFIGTSYPEQLPQVTELWYGWIVLAVHLAGLLAGLAALFKMKNNPKAAGVTFLITGIIMLLLTLGATLIQSVLFMIVGIMCLVRRPEASLAAN
ncbi:DUF4064 domain-containing protein [Jeotgalibacillus sp. R-1-5s-1]|uniref:DUF4064 domain-containing protein n=1 Tax=Jeotgalibacillus sp. R-1-5s-1 TaxID=2555897 RepID=UPI00141A84B9|nr:DUF4064 domain-containing protein [Jeotgalibacillus sp. R-1-5s-1]